MHKDKIIDVIIVAAGQGARLGGGIPKQFLPLAGIPMLQRTLSIYQSHPAIRHIQVVIGADQAEFYQAAIQDTAKLLPPVTGGLRRQDSVLRGLEGLENNMPEYVLIADAARPFTSQHILDAVIAALTPGAAVLTAVAVSDTLKLAAGDHTQTLMRQNHYLAQTPQAFPFITILELHRKLTAHDFTDDVALFEASGLPVNIVPGSAHNFKVTTPEDFQLAEALLSNEKAVRIGHGFDVHQFTAGDHVWLGGIKIPHTQGVLAHSDGDVILHALTDALLGAQGKGDIGQHFPPTDAKWKNASSDLFVRHAVELLQAAGGVVINADVTVLCEAPKVGPHRDEIRTRMAALLGIPATRVNIKATTTEKLGALGRGEGLAAEAVVSVKL